MNNKNTLLVVAFLILIASFISGSYVTTLDLSIPPEEIITIKADFEPLPDFVAYKNVKDKKSAFFSYLAPMIEVANQQINQERAYLAKLAKSSSVGEGQRQVLLELAKKYRVENQADDGQLIEALMVKIDDIPPSLVLAQAANESAWGTSRFAREGNNLFGQWCFDKGCGIVPRFRGKDETHEVKRFDSAFASVQSYMLNINRHDAYEPVRKIRLELRQTNQAIIGSKLSEGLINYSERREAYIKEIKDMIRFNKLENYDHAVNNDPYDKKTG